MGRWCSPPSLLSAVCLVLLSSVQNAAAIPYPKDSLQEAGYGYLNPRGCDNPCGYQDMYCCASGSTCYTSAGIAACSVAGGGGGYAFYTTTWTVTATYTSTYSSPIPVATGNCIPPPESGQIACGAICCASSQYCAYSGQCLDNGGGGGGGGGVVPTVIVTGGQTITTQYSAPYRVTSGTTATTGSAAGATTTDGAVSPGGTAGGLSPGAIAGIVIGTLAGIVLLLLICACCIVRGLWHGVMAILGFGGKKKTETVVVEEDFRRSGSRHSHRDAHGSWYGGRPGTVSGRKEKKSEGKGLLGLGAALGTLWLLLGLRKDKKKKAATKTRSDVSSSYWSDSYTADSPSSMSSDRRTRRSAQRQSRTQSRVSRVTRTTRISRAPSPRSPPR